MSPSETELRESLRLEADRIDAVGDFAAAAMTLERRRGRRRQATIVGAVAAVLAAAVAVPVLVHDGRGTTQVPVPASSSGQPSGSSTSSGAELPTSTTTGPTALPPVVGADAYVLDDVIHLGGREIQLGKNTQVENLAVLSNGGFFLQSHLAGGASSSEMELLSPDGRTVKELGPSGFYAVSPGGTRVLVQDGSSKTITVLDPDGTVLAKRSDDRYPVAVVDEYAYLQGDGSTTSLEWNFATGKTRKLPAHVAAVSADRTRAALQWVGPSDTFDNFCWAVVDLSAPEVSTRIERCGPKQNPDLFQPTAFSRDGTYLVGSNYVDGGFWFSAAVVRVSDGAMVLGGSGEKVVAGWTWRLDPDHTFVISRNTSVPKAEQNTLQRCTLDLSCTELAPPLAMQPSSALGEAWAQPRYVVPR
jgi:hypothetical protein